jgi:hypothetical protein
MPSLPSGRLLRLGTRLRSFLHRAIDAVVPAEVLVLEQVTSMITAHALGSVARLGVADALDSAPRTAEELAAGLKLEPDALHRTLRMLAAQGIFRLSRDGRFSHNRRSRTLKAAHRSRARAAADYFSSAPNASAYLAFDGWLRTGKSPYETVHGMNVFERFAAYPAEGQLFDQVMIGITLIHARLMAGLYPFAEVKRVCDVGGGRGALLSELLLKHRHLSGVLYDAPAVVDSAGALLQHRGVEERVERVAGTFFERVPGGCDAYLLKNVLHDWDDSTCVKILSNVRAAMHDGARVLVVETLLPKNDTDLYGSTADVHMGVVCTGRERSREDYAQLFRQSGLSLGRVFDASAIAVIEARLKGN